jgi:zinc protease
MSLARTKIAAAAASLVLFGFGVAQAAIQPVRVVSPSGVEAWLVQDRTIPLVAIEASFRGGGLSDPVGKEGLAAFAAGMLIEGAGKYDARTLQARLDDLSISINFGANADTVDVSLRTLNRNRTVAAELFRLMLTEPRFDAESVERERARLKNRINRRAGDPDSIANRILRQTIYPKHPYGRDTEGTLASIDAIGVEDLRASHKARFGRSNVTIGVVGDISSAELGALLDQTFGALPARVPEVAIPEAELQGAGELVLVDRDMPQTVVLMAGPGLKRNDSAWYAAEIANYVLGGGGFNSRLTTEVREKRGLAYGVWSALSPRERSGLVMGGVATQNNSVARTLEVVRAEWERMAKDGPDDTEFAEAKSYLIGSFLMRLDTSPRVARTLVAMQQNSLGIDYIERRNSLVAAVTIEDVRRAARRLYDFDRAAVVVVGRPQGLKPTRVINGAG